MCLPKLSSFVSPLVKPDNPGTGQTENQVREGGWKREGGKLLSICGLGSGRCLLGGGSAWMCLFSDMIDINLLSRLSALFAFSDKGWQSTRYLL